MMNEKGKMTSLLQCKKIRALLLPSLLSMMAPTMAMEGYDADLRALCSSNGRPAPVFTGDTCTTCHTSVAGNVRNAKGNIYADRRNNTTTVLNAFCPVAEIDTGIGVYYNRDASADSTTFSWTGNGPGNIGYKGSLPVYWYAQIDSDSQTSLISSNKAKSLGAQTIVAAPDNCWGHAMNFGLIKLKQPATLTITMDDEEGSNITPGFALYQGWDIGSSSSPHQTIFFGDNGVPPGMSGGSANGQISANPLSTQGLTFKGDGLGTKAGESVTRSYDLAAGDYELFVTVGDNLSRSGGYTVTLKTSTYGSAGTVPSANGSCGSANGSIFTNNVSPAATELCSSGTAGAVESLKFGRYSWTCNYIGAQGASAQCYTKGNNNKENQAPLTLTPGSIQVKSGKSVLERANGGSGPGAVKFKKISTSGVSCTIKSGGKKAQIKVTGQGVCKIYATKAQSRKFNDTKSAPATITVTP
jgi:hypothetical protein